MIFQTLDEKQHCVGVYVDGKLHFDDIPDDLSRTWKYSGALKHKDVEYAWIYGGGKSMEEVCPEHLSDSWDQAQRTMRAYMKSFEIAKIDLRNHCFFDLVPHDFLIKFCEIKNQITKHVFETYKRPPNYDYMAEAQKLLFKIKHRNLNLNNEGVRSLFVSTGLRTAAQKILKGTPYIDYNLFGTVTGRLATHPSSFPILTMRKELRRLIKPSNDWFISLDYNGAEIRTFLGLSGQPQPEEDIHQWNIHNIFDDYAMEREEAKTTFFAWLYNPDADQIKTTYYDRKKVLDTYYQGGYINTIFGRHIKVSDWKAFNYLIQSTTADLVIERAIVIDRMLEGRKSFVSHIVHDELVIDFDLEDRDILMNIKEEFARNKLDTFMVNLKAGRNYYDLEDFSL
jgi:hypothetical protein